MPNDPHPPAEKRRRSERRSFAVALTVCLLAAAAAAWSTFASVTDYLQNHREPLPAAVSLPEESVPSKAIPTAAPQPTPSPQASETPAPSSPPHTAAAGPLYLPSESWIYPCGGSVQKPFSGDTLVYSETMRDWRTHPGCDIACRDGEDVLACANGVVLETTADPLWGNTLVVEHGDFTVRYCGVDETFAVSPGEIVRQGQTIGTVTAVPCEAAEAPHLHLEVWQNGTRTDPAARWLS